MQGLKGFPFAREILFVPLFVLWLYFLFYPNPLLLGAGVYRLFSPPVNPDAMEEFLHSAPPELLEHEDLSLLEKYVLQELPYSLDWELYGMPWYLPTVEEVLERKAGDCKGRALVLASLLEAMEVTYQWNISPFHVWVSYEGKLFTSIENPGVSFFADDGEVRTWQLPDVEPGETLKWYRKQLWDPMPLSRKLNLYLALYLALFTRYYLNKAAPGMNRLHKSP